MAEGDVRLGGPERVRGMLGGAVERGGVNLQGSDLPVLLAVFCLGGLGRCLESAEERGNLLLEVRHLLRVLERALGLQPGDLIFTGTPAGVGPVRAISSTAILAGLKRESTGGASSSAAFSSTGRTVS